MVYDREFAGPIRELIGSDPELTEKKMFGGLTFLISGKHGHRRQHRGWRDGSHRSLVATTNHPYEHARPRHARMVAIISDDLRTDDQLAPWVEIGTG
jgi:hypothetical protein